MKLIKKTQPKQVNLNVGDKVRVVQIHEDGRGAVLTSKARLEVVKVNKVTFDAQDKEGNVFRVDIDMDNWKKVG